MEPQSDWHQLAFDVYRLARQELARVSTLPRDQDVDYYVEELTEALLDLKQATIAEKTVQATIAMDEIHLIISELRDQFG